MTQKARTRLQPFNFPSFFLFFAELSGLPFLAHRRAGRARARHGARRRRLSGAGWLPASCTRQSATAAPLRSPQARRQRQLNSTLSLCNHAPRLRQPADARLSISSSLLRNKSECQDYTKNATDRINPLWVSLRHMEYNLSFIPVEALQRAANTFHVMPHGTSTNPTLLPSCQQPR